MSRFQQGSPFKLERKSRPDVWVFRWYDNTSGTRRYKKQIAGSCIDIKVAQELLRHASCRTTLDVYTRAVSQQKRDANSKVVEMMLPVEVLSVQHPSAPLPEAGTVANY